MSKDIYWKGKNTSDMSREELLAVVREMFNKTEELHHKRLSVGDSEMLEYCRGPKRYE